MSSIMRKLLVTASLLSALALPVVAQDHSMHEGLPPLTREQLEQRFREIFGRPSRPQLPAEVIAPVAGNAVKTFNISAKRFSFTVSPAPFVVNQGDVVTLNFSVVPNDTTHGLFMETYIGGVNVATGKSTQIQFTATDAGVFNYVCNVPSCGSGHSNMVGQMTVNAAVAPPVISSVSPSTVSTAGGGVTISGSGFAGAAVTVDGVAATSVNTISGSTITANLPAHDPGTATLRVTNGDGQSASTTISYAVPAPQINSVNPSTGSTSGGTLITINGGGFQSGATVTIGGRAAGSVTFVDTNTITALTPLGLSTEQATVPQTVVVTLPNGQSASKSGGFTYFIPALAVTSVSPSAGPAGTLLTIKGAGFTSGVQMTATIGGTAVTVTVIDPVTLTVSAPPHAPGAVDVKITRDTTVTVANGFTYVSVSKRARAVRH